MSDSREFSGQYAGVKERTILRNVYLWMTLGLTLTGVVAWGVSHNLQLYSIAARFFWVALIGELVLVFFLSARINRLSAGAATGAFIFYAALNGITLAPIFIAYTNTTIARAFFCAAATFGGMAVYGMTTKRDLSGWSYFLTMGLWGILITSVINFFIGSTTVSYLISYAGVALFLGLTAYDTQAIAALSQSYSGSVDETTYIRFSIMGALKLYLDFINLFLFILRIFGRRK